MFEVTKDWNPRQALLKEIILKKDKFSQTQNLLLEMHSLVHSSTVYKANSATYFDEIWDGLGEAAFRTMPTVKDATIAWDIWHITRIEDITVNILIADGSQVLNEEWLGKLNTAVRDTGNAMTDEEIIVLSTEMDKDALFEYRNAVGKRTKEIIEGLDPGDMGRKFRPEQVARISAEGGVTEHKDSVWLLDFWGRKTVAGIFQMPVTRHQIVHLNDCRKLKQKCQK
jgi:hypothetical protein